MKFLVAIDKHGESEVVGTIPEGGGVITMTIAAAKHVHGQLREAGNVCKRCYLTCRTYELVDGQCKGVGCNADVEQSALLDLPAELSNAMLHTVLDTAIRSFARDVLKDVPHGDIPSVGETKPKPDDYEQVC